MEQKESPSFFHAENIYCIQREKSRAVRRFYRKIVFLVGTAISMIVLELSGGFIEKSSSVSEIHTGVIFFPGGSSVEKFPGNG